MWSSRICVCVCLYMPARVEVKLFSNDLCRQIVDVCVAAPCAFLCVCSGAEGWNSGTRNTLVESSGLVLYMCVTSN